MTWVFAVPLVASGFPDVVDEPLPQFQSLHIPLKKTWLLRLFEKELEVWHSGQHSDSKL